MGNVISKALIIGVERIDMDGRGCGSSTRLLRSTSVIDGTHPGLMKYPANSTGGI
jgi:hypothetical protein